MESAKLSTTLPGSPTAFPRFPQLPADIRLYIYRIATPRERFVHLEAIFDDDTDSEYDDDDDDELEAWERPSGEYSSSTQALDRVLQEYLKDIMDKSMRFFTNRGQTQLERYGFTSPRPRPELPDDKQLRVNVLRRYLQKRPVTMWSPNPTPVLLHVCRESRDYLRRLGYELAFPTYTSPAATWFNFNTDILFTKPLTPGRPAEWSQFAEFGIYDGGCWYLGQCGESLERIKKLAVPVPENYLYTKDIPLNIHEIVQQCGNLQELCFVNNAWHDWYVSNDPDWSTSMSRADRLYMGSSSDQWPVRVELALEEMLGQHLPVNPWQDRWQEFPEGTFISELPGDIEKQIRQHDPALNLTVDERFRRESWTTPKVTFGVVISQEALELFLKKKHRFVRQNANAEWSMEPYARHYDRHIEDIAKTGQEGCHLPTEKNTRVPSRFWGWKKDVSDYVYGPSKLPWPLGLMASREDDDASTW